MNCMLIMLATSAPAVDYGWQPMDDGQLEYIIQIEPELLQLLADGEEITNVIHPDVSGVKRFRVRVGTNDLPRIGKAPAPINDDPAPEPVNPPSGGGFFIPDEPLVQQEHEDEPSPEFGPVPVAPPLMETPGTATEPPESTNRQDTRPVVEPEIPPAVLQPDPVGEPIDHRQAAYVEPAATQPPAQNNAQKQSSEAVSADTKPWLPLVITALVLFASIGLNAYLGWIAFGVSQRYRQTLRDLRDGAAEGAEGAS